MRPLSLAVGPSVAAWDQHHTRCAEVVVQRLGDVSNASILSRMPHRCRAIRRRSSHKALALHSGPPRAAQMVATLRTTALSARPLSLLRSCKAVVASLDPPSRMVGIEHMVHPYRRAMVGCTEHDRTMWRAAFCNLLDHNHKSQFYGIDTRWWYLPPSRTIASWLCDRRYISCNIGGALL